MRHIIKLIKLNLRLLHFTFRTAIYHVVAFRLINYNAIYAKKTSFLPLFKCIVSYIKILSGSIIEFICMFIIKWSGVKTPKPSTSSHKELRGIGFNTPSICIYTVSVLHNLN